MSHIHKTHIAIVTLIVAIALAALFTFAPSVTRFEAMSVLYLPSLVLAILLSDGHHPGEVSIWASFLVYTLVYWAVLFVAYALALDMFLGFRATRSLRQGLQSMQGDELNVQSLLQITGSEIQRLDVRRRGHFFLKAAEPDGRSDQARGKAVFVAPASHPRGSAFVRQVTKHVGTKLGEEEATIVLHRLASIDGQTSQGA